MKKIFISDVTLRDGNHAIDHSIDVKTIKDYCRLLNKTGVDICEIGHGMELGHLASLVEQKQIILKASLLQKNHYKK